MNQNHANLNSVFLSQEWKNISLRVGLIFLSEVFQFTIAEICNIQINYPLIQCDCDMLFAYVIASMLSNTTLVMMLQRQIFTGYITLISAYRLQLKAYCYLHSDCLSRVPCCSYCIVNIALSLILYFLCFLPCDGIKQ